MTPTFCPVTYTSGLQIPQGHTGRRLVMTYSWRDKHTKRECFGSGVFKLLFLQVGSGGLRWTQVMSQPSQQTGSSAPDSPGLVVTANVQKYALKKKKVLSPEETELFELTQAAGVCVDQEVFKIIVDLLKMNVAPQAVFQTLKAMCAGQRVAETGGGPGPGPGPGPAETSAAHSTNIPTAPTETRVRSKAAAAGGHSEKSREASGQRVQRQPSATRGQKTKSSGSSSSSSQINST